MMVSEYERVKCEPCNGKGRRKRVKGQSYRTMNDGRRGPRCSYCQGRGYTETRKPVASLALSRPQSRTGPQAAPDEYEFPYQRTFDAIVAAVDIQGERTLGVSVEAFQDKFNSHRDAEANPLRPIASLPSRSHQP